MSSGTDRALVVLFVAAILLPGALWVGIDQDDGATRRELRRPAVRPEWSWDAPALTAFPKLWEDYFADAFGGRTSLMRAHAVLKWFVFGRSPTEAMTRGEDGWLFLVRERAMAAHRGVATLDAERLEAWRRVLEERRWWLAQRDIPYVFVLAPSKAQVYPERVPARFTVIGPSPREQFVEHMARYSDFPLTDYFEVLRAEKEHDRPGDYVFYPLGTHWTSRGALAAYRRIVADLQSRFGGRFAGLRVPSREEVVATPSDEQGDSWDGRMYLDGFVSQEVWDYGLEERRARRLARGTEGMRTTTRDTSLPHLLVLHDSFGPALRSFLPESAETTVWRNADNFDPRFILDEQPNAVVQVNVDRLLLRSVTKHSCLLDAEETGRLFEASDRILLRASGAELDARGAASVSDLPDGSARLDTVSAEDGALLPGFALPTHASLIVRIELSRGTAGVVQVGDATSDSIGGFEARWVAAGRHIVDVHVPAIGFTGRLCVRGDGRASQFVIHSVEVRASRF